jgi:hypothetical protein
MDGHPGGPGPYAWEGWPVTGYSTASGALAASYGTARTRLDRSKAVLVAALIATVLGWML